MWDDAYSRKIPIVATGTFFDPGPSRAHLVAVILNGAPDLGRTNYVGMGGKFGIINVKNCDVFDGLLRTHWELPTTSLEDNASQTLMFGEVVGGENIDPVNEPSFT